MNQSEFCQPESAKAIHELMFGKSVKPNRQTDIERLEGAWFLFPFVTHVYYPIHTGSDQVQSAFMNPFRPIAAFVIHVVFHFFLLAFIDPRHA